MRLPWHIQLPIGLEGETKVGDSKSVIGRPSKYHKLVNGLNLYLSEARANPALSLSILAIGTAIDVKKSTIYLYQHEPEVAKLLKNIRALSTARKTAMRQLNELSSAAVGRGDVSTTTVNSELVDVATDTVCLDVLTMQASGAVQKAVWSMSRFTGRHRKHCYVSDLPRIVYDLDVTLAELNRIRQELNGLSDEWRQSSLSGCEVTNLETQLSFPNIYKEQV